jgi:Protein of unknown function (DUF2971)
MHQAPETEGISDVMKQKIQLEEIFLPGQRRLREQFHTLRGRFVHYTSAESALSIIENKRLWMRNATSMADMREIRLGYEVMNDFFAEKVNTDSFIQALDACYSGAAGQAINSFGFFSENIQQHTYISSISEHDRREDLHGRLSMWRAFGGNLARVAIVLKLPVFTSAMQALNITLNPVEYIPKSEKILELSQIIKNIQDHAEFLRGVEASTLTSYIFAMMTTGVTCLKHDGFHEEREWRIIHAPYMSPSDLMGRSIKTIGGIPQIVHEIPLDARVSELVSDLDVSRIFDRLIIGPTKFPRVLLDAFVDTLSRAGVPDAHEKVIVSGIPLRT